MRRSVRILAPAALMLLAVGVGIVVHTRRGAEGPPPPRASTPITLIGVSPYVKVQPGDRLVRPAPTLSAPRGGSAALQVLVSPLGRGIPVAARPSALRGSGSQIAASAITVSAERTVVVEQPSSAVPAGLLGPVPDPLVPPANAQVASDGRIVLFVRIDVAAEQPPGRYTGELTVSAGGRHGTLPLSLVVATARISPADGIATYFLVWATRADERERRRGASAAYYRLLAADGFGNGREGSLVDLGGPLPGESPIAGAERLARAAAAIRVARPEAEIVSYAYDEPTAATLPKVRAWGAALRAADPSIRQLVTSPPEPGLRGAVGILAVHLGRLGAGVPAEVASLGAEPWIYSSCCETPGDATLLLDDHATSNLAVAPATWLQGGRGLLYWGVSVFAHDPWKVTANPVDAPDFVGNGDGVLLYPGRPVGLPGPVPSLRLELVRSGLQLAALADLLQRRGRGAEARAILDQVLSGDGRYDPNPAAWEAAAAQLLQAASAA